MWESEKLFWLQKWHDTLPKHDVMMRHLGNKVIFTWRNKTCLNTLLSQKNQHGLNSCISQSVLHRSESPRSATVLCCFCDMQVIFFSDYASRTHQSPLLRLQQTRNSHIQPSSKFNNTARSWIWTLTYNFF